MWPAGPLQRTPITHSICHADTEAVLNLSGTIHSDTHHLMARVPLHSIKNTNSNCYSSLPEHELVRGLNVSRYSVRNARCDLSGRKDSDMGMNHRFQSCACIHWSSFGSHCQVSWKDVSLRDDIKPWRTELVLM